MRLRLAITGFAVSFLLLSAGCRRSASAHDREANMDQPIMQSYAQLLTIDEKKQELAPSDLASQHQEKGVGLGLQIEGRTFKAGQNIPLLVVYEDVAATGPVSSTDCNGFSITIVEVDKGTSDVAPIRPCSTTTELAKNDVALVKGNLRFLHTSLFGSRQELTQPGRYLIRATWQSYVPRKGAFRQADGYIRVHSNVIPITITR